ncbi:MAG: small subunit ribosomal protein [Kosmotoga sp.]|nr:30S ribosomal protein S6 [Kosmotoga sp.]MDI3524030.1 small subunit ribosomal protein [Kosmotoga sp.]MDK2954004.1 small subunit ribosomal protein [Kosmotoga sp.]
MSEKRIYETMFIVSPELPDEAREAIAEKVKRYIEERVEGTIEQFDRWGMRKLAYRVRKGFTEGDYTVVLFRADPEKVNSLERLYNITPEIFRWQTFRREDLEKEEKKARKKAAEAVVTEVIETPQAEEQNEKSGVSSEIPQETTTEPSVEE